MSRTVILILQDGSAACERLTDDLRESAPDADVRGVHEPTELPADADLLFLPATHAAAGEVTRRVREIDSTLPVFLAVDPAAGEVPPAALDAGADGVLRLPGSAAELRALVRLARRMRSASAAAGGPSLSREQRLLAVGRLAGGVAHDFNNALTGIMGYAALAQEETEKDRSVHGMLDQIIKGADRAASLARHLLTFARKTVVQPREVDLNLVIAEMERMLRRVLPESVELHVGLDRDLARCHADPTRLEQLLVHLLVDSGDALPAGGETHIETHHVPPAVAGGPNTVRISIRSQPASGQPAVSSEDAVAQPGLGYEIAHEIVEQSGGTIRVLPDPNGPAYEVEFPALEEATYARTFLGEPSTAPGRGETILLVDDEDMVLRMAEELLRAANYRVISALGPDRAIDLARQHAGRIDLVLTDVVMPGQSGPAMVRKLRQRAPDLRVLYMSGYPDEALSRGGGLEKGATLIEKPFSPARLTRTIRELLDAPAARHPDRPIL
jgi:two-component system cell cycle sensor histidine kinase/response regulator CckA